MAATEKLSLFSQELSESDLTMYEGVEITGSDVVNFIKKHLGSYTPSEQADIYVRVQSATTERTYQNNEYIASIQDFSSERYIKPVSRFLCNITRDANDVIIGLVFAQQ